jgi:hypothetical protein
MKRCGFDLTSSGQDQVEDFCEQSNKQVGSRKGREFFDQLNNQYFLKKVTAPWSW